MNDFAKHIGRTHQHGDIELLQVQKFNDGWLCMFTITTNGREGVTFVQHRVSYICRDTSNNNPFTVWDNIA